MLAVPDLSFCPRLYYNKAIRTRWVWKCPSPGPSWKMSATPSWNSTTEIYPWGVDMTTDEGQAALPTTVGQTTAGSWM